MRQRKHVHNVVFINVNQTMIWLWQPWLFFVYMFCHDGVFVYVLLCSVYNKQSHLTLFRNVLYICIKKTILLSFSRKRLFLFALTDISKAVYPTRRRHAIVCVRACYKSDTAFSVTLQCSTHTHKTKEHINMIFVLARTQLSSFTVLMLLTAMEVGYTQHIYMHTINRIRSTDCIAYQRTHTCKKSLEIITKLRSYYKRERKRWETCMDFSTKYNTQCFVFWKNHLNSLQIRWI